MRSHRFTSAAPILLLLAALTACGSFAQSQPLVTDVPPTQPAVTLDSAEIVPSATPVPPSATPLPPSATPAPVEPTAAPTLEASPVPTEAAAAPVDPNAPLVLPPLTDTDQTTALIMLADPNNGRTLFNTILTTSLGPQACASCHYVTPQEAEGVKAGPNQWNLRDRAGQRVEGQSAAAYIVNSILHPNDYVVPNYAPGVMPGNYEQILDIQQVYDLTAYLLTVGD